MTGIADDGRYIRRHGPELAVLQKPDLPAGPEITCLTIVLNYLGDYPDKVSLAENYLTLAEPGTASPYEAYLVDPKVAEGSYGCYGLV